MSTTTGKATSKNSLMEFTWSVQPQAAALVQGWIDNFREELPAIENLASRLYHETGTRLVDWVDHLCIPAGEAPEEQLSELGFLADQEGELQIWRHMQGMFPTIVVAPSKTRRLAIKVESVADFASAWQLDDSVSIIGAPLAPWREIRVAAEQNVELLAVERHGYRGFERQDLSPDDAQAVLCHGETLRRRRRDFATYEEGFEHTSQLIAAAKRDLGIHRTCDLFFAAEREYWQRRNRAARVQKARQDVLGLGWANHDHHTYRSSRTAFRHLIAILEELGFVCRERFYAGREAGWGAQVIEQPTAGVVIFADVDLLPEEVTGDFAHEPLAELDKLGTVGLWCMLHGDAFLQAGMHHLECQFDFDAARAQLKSAGVDSMQPFTDFTHLRQAFTTGEIWPVAESRIGSALAGGFITLAQAEKFRQSGALGSHLEILERNDGYKGFNQTGISEIISRTDPRKAN